MSTQPLLFPTARTTRNHRANRLLVTDQAAHQWYRFVLSFPPHLVRDYLERFCCERGSVVLDPFAGTGTTIVEAQKHGMRGIGIEALPMAHFAADTKLRWDIDGEAFLHEAERIAEEVSYKFHKQGLSDSGVERPHENLQLRRLSPAAESLLLSNSVSPLPLHKLLELTDAINSAPVSNHKQHLRLALAKAAVDDVSNLYFGPEVGVKTVRSDARVVEPWLNQVRTMANDLSALALHPAERNSEVFYGDARTDLRFSVGLKKIDAVITSPPYPNEKDYTRTTRLETVLLGFASSRSDMQTLKRRLVRSNTRGVYKSDTDDQWITEFPEIGRIAKEIEERRLALGKTSGFEKQYARVTKLYFGGMLRHLQEMKQVLRPGAQLAYVVGDQASYLQVMIRTGTLLADIAQSLGYRIDSIDLFRTRISTATRQQLREEVVVLRAPEK